MTNGVMRGAGLAVRRARRHPLAMWWLILFLALILAAPARAELRALLVGVGDYTHLESDLRGPPNDVRLMAETLLARGADPSQVVALLSGPGTLPEGVRRGTPTLAGIRAALADLVQQAAPGDTVVFHFSGHGSQTPDRNGDEAGGFDEILLPMDVRGWNGAAGAVEGALTDDELQIWAQALLDRGARLVGVIDACHSDTGFRALGGAVARGLDPAALGVPPGAAGAVRVDAPPLTGDFVFLYSAQSDQRAFEFPLGDPAEAGHWYGAFTLAFTQVLRDAPQASWAQVLAATRAAMTQGSARQEPDGEGPLLAAGVFGDAPDGTRFPLAKGHVQAGLLQGLASGAGVAFYAAAAGGAPLGEARLTAVSPVEARLDAPPPPRAQWAEVVEPAPPAPLRLAAPVRVSGDDPAGWQAVLAAERAAGGFTAAAPPDLVPLILGADLALAGAEGALDPDGPGSTPRVTLHPGETAAAALSRVLAQAGHALRLRAVLAGLSGRGLTVGGPPVAMQITRRAGRPRAGGGCDPAAPAQPFAEEPVTPCDELWLALINRAGRAQDVTVLYQGRDFAVVPIWPVAGLSNRLAPGTTARVGLRIEAPEGGGAGVEEILVLAVAAEPGAPRADLTHLATPQTLRGAGDATSARIAALMEGTRPRGFTARRNPFSLIRQVLRLQPSGGNE